MLHKTVVVIKLKLIFLKNINANILNKKTHLVSAQILVKCEIFPINFSDGFWVKMCLQKALHINNFILRFQFGIFLSSTLGVRINLHVMVWFGILKKKSISDDGRVVEF